MGRKFNDEQIREVFIGNDPKDKNVLEVLVVNLERAYEIFDRYNLGNRLDAYKFVDIMSSDDQAVIKEIENILSEALKDLSEIDKLRLHVFFQKRIKEDFLDKLDFEELQRAKNREAFYMKWIFVEHEILCWASLRDIGGCFKARK